jgi:hypothetical protein
MSQTYVLDRSAGGYELAKRRFLADLGDALVASADLYGDLVVRVQRDAWRRAASWHAPMSCTGRGINRLVLRSVSSAASTAASGNGQAS